MQQQKSSTYWRHRQERALQTWLFNIRVTRARLRAFVEAHPRANELPGEIRVALACFVTLGHQERRLLRVLGWGEP